MIGQTVSHYRIVDKLGEGGMGIVYLAEDDVLHRQVALKALPVSATADPERRQRFLQEARAASALNHPNIITIFDVCESDGSELIVMEYVRGKTLGDLIGRKGLRIGEALKYAIQITDALAAAHKAGLVHRDLKPSNIMVSFEGQVKILDFGLAKLAGGLLAGELEATKTIVLGAPQTMDGVLIGTAAYMSPEQAEGKRVDSRSDVFAFGAVLYEMVTGQKAFQGDSTASVLAAILKEQPKSPTLVSDQVPRELEKVIGRCLRKDPARRYQATEDVRLALEEVKEDSESGAPLPAEIATGRARPRWAELAAAVVLLVVGVLGGWWWSRRSGGEAASPAGPVLTRLTSDAGLASQPALSPDGRLIAYASDRSGEDHLDIWVQQLAGGDPIRITRDPADDYEPSFSADGATIAFRSDRSGGGIYVVSALGGEPRFLARGGHRPRYSPDGSQIAFRIGSSTPGPPGPGSSRAFVIGAGGGEPRQVAADFEAAFTPEWVDNAHLILAAIRKGAEDPRAADYWVVPVAGGAAVPTGIAPAIRKQGLGAMGLAPLTRGDGNRFVLSLSQGDALNLWEVTLSPRTWEIQGPARRLTFGTELEVHPALAGRTMAFAAGSETVEIASVELDANQGKVSGAPRRLTNTRYTRGPSLSADGKKLAYVVARGPQARLYVRELESGKELLLAGPARLPRPILNADGSKVAYQEMRERRGRTYVVAAEGGVPEQVCDDCGMLQDWSRDGAKILYESGKPPAIYALDLKSGAKIAVLRHAEKSLTQAQFSPDGRWIAFQAGQNGIYAAPLKAGAPESEWIPITGPNHDNERPRWSPDGRLVYFTSTRDGYRCAWAQRLDEAKRPSGAPFAVFHSHSARLLLGRAGGYPFEFAVAPGRLAFTMAESSGNIWLAKFE